MDTQSLSAIPSTSLLGELLADWEAFAYAACLDEEGYCDYEDLDHELDQLALYREDIARDVDIFEVYASEINRGL
jgi:hypothetical protein